MDPAGHRRRQAPGGRALLLFLGSGATGHHLMAEGLARTHADERTEVVSGSLAATRDYPLETAVMREIGIELDGLPRRTPEDLELFSFDVVVTLADFDRACRPNLPGMPPHYHWELPTPLEGAGRDAQLAVLRRARDTLARKVELVFASDMLRGLAIARGNLELVLDNLAHAVMAHTMNRRIFFFNQAAERITGCRREEVLGRDCHEVFQPARFCGGNCRFCASSEGAITSGQLTTRVEFERPGGDVRVLDMTVRPLSDATGVDVGALCSFRDITEFDELKRRVRHRHELHGLVGRDPKTLALFGQVREVAAVNVPVLVQGESGTGKELIARAIHAESDRAGKPFVAINCGALPEGILESELFGHVRGAFTGAVRDKRGRFELAHGGTIFLDEVAELSPAMQVKLLRVLQERCFERVGGERTIHVDVRLLSATNQDLRRQMARGRFRRDLYYRLCVVPISAPPLRERRLDIPALTDVFLEASAREQARDELRPSTEALDALVRYPWPGNVRELRNVLEYVSVKCSGGVFGVEHLPPELHEPLGGRGATSKSRRRGPRPKLDAARVRQALEESGGNRAAAARRLGVGRTTLYRFLDSMGGDAGA